MRQGGFEHFFPMWIQADHKYVLTMHRSMAEPKLQIAARHERHYRYRSICTESACIDWTVVKK